MRRPIRKQLAYDLRDALRDYRDARRIAVRVLVNSAAPDFVEVRNMRSAAIEVAEIVSRMDDMRRRRV